MADFIYFSAGRIVFEKELKMKSTIYQSAMCELKELNNLFIEMSAKSCNMKCKHCYIDFPLSRNVKDFIPCEKIKEAITDSKNEKIECIYLTGGEPMMHPDFNAILRTCLKRSNVCIFTNGSFINEKKARFLKRVEEESSFEIIFKLSLDHFDEVKNDDIRGRGAYRQTVHAVKYLMKYGFRPIICVTNYYNLSKSEIFEKYSEIFSDIGYEINDQSLKINVWHDKNSTPDEIDWSWKSLDCECGRVLTVNGVYSCPFLANDHRGRSGADFKDFSRKTALETSFCTSCIKNSESMFSLNYKLYE